MLNELYAKYREHGAKERKIEALIIKHQKRLKKLQEKGGWYRQVLVPLAEALSKELNIKLNPTSPAEYIPPPLYIPKFPAIVPARILTRPVWVESALL